MDAMGMKEAQRGEVNLKIPCIDFGLLLPPTNRKG